MQKPALILIFIAATLAQSAAANFIDPAHPTTEDRLDNAALSCGGALVLAFFDHFFNKHRSIDADALDNTINILAETKYPNYDGTRFNDTATAYFRIILQEVGRNVADAGTDEERQQVYFKTKEWLTRATGITILRFDKPPRIIEKRRC